MDIQQSIFTFMIHSSNTLKSLAAFVAGLLVLACTPTVIPELSLSDLAANFEATGSLEKSISVTSNVDWTVSCPDAWVTVSPAAGTGNGSFKITVAANDKFEARSSTVTVKAGDKTASVRVSQLSLTPSILVSPASLEADAAGATVSVDVTSNASWTVSVPSGVDWITPDAASGEGSKKVTFTVAANAGFETRSADVTFTAQGKTAVVKISQAAATPALEVNPFAVMFDPESSSVEIKVTSNAPWTISVDADWLTVEPASGQGDATVILTVAENNVRTERTAVVTVKETVGNTEKTVNVSQEALPLGHKADSLALVKIYTIADGANWKESRRWTLTEPMDQWLGIKLNEEGRVTELSITNGTVTTVEWEIPEVLTDLTELSNLQIVGSKLKGQIPEFLYGMTKLSKIRFNTNNLTGAISDKISQLTDLTELYLNGNKDLGGSIPTTIGQLKKLESINIAQTSIGGAIPQALSECTALKNFMAYSNKLSGEIPDFWDKLPNIGVLQLYGNPDITGPIPASIGHLKNATGIQLKDCNLTGNIPASFGGLEKCGNLQLSGNKLSGVIPAEVQAHPKFQATSGWKYTTNILPQQEGYGLTLE